MKSRHKVEFVCKKTTNSPRKYLCLVFLGLFLLPFHNYGVTLSGSSISYRPFVEYTLFLSNNTLMVGNPTDSSSNTAMIRYPVLEQRLAIASTSESLPPVAVGGVPNGIAFDPDNGNLYVANFAPGTLSVINGSTNSVVTTINLNFPVSPWDVGYNPHNGDIYVSETKNGAVSVVSGKNNTLITNVAVGDDMLSGDHDDRPNGVAYDPFNTAMYVAMYGSGFLAEINSDTNTLFANAPLGYDPYVNRGLWGVAFDPSNCNFYASNELANTLTVINAATDLFVSSISVDRSPNGVAVETVQGPSYGYVFVANYAANSISVIDEASNRVIDTIGVGQNPDGIALDPVTGDFYVANFGDGTVSVIDGVTDSVVNTLNVGSGASDVAYDPLNGNMYVTDSNLGAVSIISTGHNSSATSTVDSDNTAISTCSATATSSNSTETSVASTTSATTVISATFHNSSSQIESFSTSDQSISSISEETTSISSLFSNINSSQDSTNITTSVSRESISYIITIVIVASIVISLFALKRRSKGSI